MATKKKPAQKKEKPDITITIRGRVGIGKTTIQRDLGKLLIDAGYQVRCFDGPINRGRMRTEFDGPGTGTRYLVYISTVLG